MDRISRQTSKTFSLVALDPRDGYLGSAVASKYFAVGAAVPHLRQGVGAFNTQSSHNHRLAIQGLALMERGTEPQTAFECLRPKASGISGG